MIGDIGPALDPGPELRAPGRENSAVLQQPQSVEVTRGDRAHSVPVLHLALAGGVVASCADAPVGTNGHRVPVAAADTGDLAPVVNLPLPLDVAAGGHQRPVDAQSCAESPSCGDGDDVPPVPDVALPLRVPTAGQHCSVVAQAQRVRPAGVGGHMDTACRHGDDASPLRDPALSGVIRSDSDHPSVGETPDGVPTSSGQGNMSHHGASFAPIPAESRRSGQ